MGGVVKVKILSFISTQIDLGLNVDIEHCALGRQKMTWVLK